MNEARYVASSTMTSSTQRLSMLLLAVFVPGLTTKRSAWLSSLHFDEKTPMPRDDLAQIAPTSSLSLCPSSKLIAAICIADPVRKMQKATIAAPCSWC